MALVLAAFEHVKDRYGYDKSDLELLHCVDDEFLAAHDQHVRLVLPDGSWAVTRHVLNRRGDEASVLQRKQSVESVGIVQDVRGGAWLQQDADLGVHDRFTALHWATLIEGAERAYRDDPDNKNRCVQMSIVAGLSRCKVYSRRLPVDCAQFLIDLGNAFNEQATSTTLLEKLRSTALIEPQWANKRKDMNWTTTSMSAKLRDEKKFNFVNSLSKGRWSNYHAYEVCNTFYRESQKITIGTRTVWHELEHFIQQTVDLPSMTLLADEKVFQVAADSLRTLRDSHPEMIVPVIALSLPQVGRNGHGLGKCSWLPNGLPVLISIDTSSMENLLVVMYGAKSLSDTFPQKQKPKKGAQVVVLDDLSSDTTFLQHMSDTVTYLKKIDDQQQDKATAFKYIILYAGLCNGINFYVKGINKEITSWSLLRRMMKEEFYRTAQLRPRASDDDFMGDNVDFDNKDAEQVKTEAATQTLVSLMNDTLQFVPEIMTYLDGQKVFTTLVLAHMAVFSVVNSTMLSVFSSVASKGGKLGSQREALTLLTNLAADEVLRLLPTRWDGIASATDDLRSLGEDDLVELAKQFEAFGALLAVGFSSKMLFCMRMQALLHVLMSLGLQQFNMQGERGNIVMTPYMSQIMHKGISGLASKYDLSRKQVRCAIDQHQHSLALSLTLLMICFVNCSVIHYSFGNPWVFLGFLGSS